MRLNEKNIFLFDGVGGLLSTISTGLVLPLFSEWTGVSVFVSTVLAAPGLICAAYSLSCYGFAKRTMPWMLTGIICANLLYCLLVTVLIFNLRDITIWGRAYFAGEALIIAGLVLLEAAIYRRAFAATMHGVLWIPDHESHKDKI